MLTSQKVKEIAEELRTTRNEKDGKMAFDYIYKKYEHLFVNRGGFDDFLYLMKICAIFFSSQGEETERIRKNTVYKYV